VVFFFLSLSWLCIYTHHHHHHDLYHLLRFVFFYVMGAAGDGKTGDGLVGLLIHIGNKTAFLYTGFEHYLLASVL